MTAVMVMGCTSWAGKSLVATALCRWYARQGLHVAPFKGQNMSNNARVVDGGEIGVAQWLQARAARVRPDVRMQPVLVKPEHGGSQVVVLGRVDDPLSARPWTERPARLWPRITQALDAVLAEHDLVVCEGAGSPAETNLRDTDLANTRVAAHAEARALLVADIDRGGAFAHLLGTWTLLAPADRARLDGFVLNRFRGDPTLLREAPAELSARTGMADAGVLPALRHRLPDEDGARDLLDLAPPGSAADVAVVRWPTASNLDELAVLAGAARVRWATGPGDLAGADLVLLPGSKDVPGDLRWLRARGLDAAVTAHAAAGGRVLGVCGGLQVLGRAVDAGAERVDGLGLLPVVTRYGPTKTVRHLRPEFAARLPGPWAGLAGLAVDAYDIRHGRTTAVEPGVRAVLGDEHGWAAGTVLGVACHGLLEDPAVVRALLPGAPPVTDPLEATLDGLADAVEEHLDTDLLRRMTGGLL